MNFISKPFIKLFWGAVIICLIGIGVIIGGLWVNSLKTDQIANSYVNGYESGYEKGATDKQAQVNEVVINNLEQDNKLKVRIQRDDGVEEITLIPEVLCNINETE